MWMIHIFVHQLASVKLAPETLVTAIATRWLVCFSSSNLFSHNHPTLPVIYSPYFA